jgi:hypothetical protein
MKLHPLPVTRREIAASAPAGWHLLCSEKELIGEKNNG